MSCNGVLFLYHDAINLERFYDFAQVIMLYEWQSQGQCSQTSSHCIVQYGLAKKDPNFYRKKW